MPQHHHFRWRLMRDLAVFQLKLAADAVRDLLLSPLSIISALVDLSLANHASDSWFYRVLRLGRYSESWINLFAAADHTDTPGEPGPAAPDADQRPHSIDQWVAQLERLLKEQYERGGMTANAKHAVDRSLDHWRQSFREEQQPAEPNSITTDPAPPAASSADEHPPQP